MTVGQLVKLDGSFWLVIRTRRDERGLVHTLLQSMTPGSRETKWVAP